MKAGKARRDAALVLGFDSPPHFLQEAWPVRLTADVIATLQGDIRVEDIRAEVAAGKLPRYLDEFDPYNAMVAPLSAVDVIGFLDELGIVPSVHILAWLEATTTPLPPLPPLPPVAVGGDKPDIYQVRLASFERWFSAAGHPDLSKYTVESLFNIVSNQDGCWSGLSLASFRRSFWQRYAKDNGVLLKAGRRSV